jgi:hypothetical protein
MVPKKASGASRRSVSTGGGRRARGARTSAPTSTRSRRSAPETNGAEPRRAGDSSSPARTSRRDDLLALVREQPGVTLAQAATRFGLKDSTSLYSVARRLQAEGLIHKAGPELHPSGNAQKA